MNPDFYETQLQKPHNKLKKAQIPLRENKLSLELKLGGGSTNPRSKGTPQPPLRRKSIRGAFSYLFSRAPLVFAGCPRVLSSRFLFTFSFFFFFFLFSSFSSTYIYPPDVHCGCPRLRSRVSLCLSVCLSSMAPLSTFARLFTPHQLRISMFSAAATAAASRSRNVEAHHAQERTTAHIILCMPSRRFLSLSLPLFFSFSIYLPFVKLQLGLHTLSS